MNGYDDSSLGIPLLIVVIWIVAVVLFVRAIT